MYPNVQLAHVIVAVVGLLTAVSAYIYLNKKKRTSVPKHWIPVGQVSKIFLYPLKSGHRLDVDSAECTAYGLSTETVNDNEIHLRDRSFVVYGENNLEFKSARTYPKMVLIESSIHDREYVVFDAPNQRPLYVKVPNSDTADKVQITLHSNEKADTLDCGDEAALWFSRLILDNPNGLRLGYHDGLFKRDITKIQDRELKAFTELSSDDLGLYSDLAAFLLINQSSIDSFNTNLEEPVSATNFRPNILVNGDNITPFSEEHWDWIKIGTAIFRNVKPCTRCVMTTVNPETGIRAKTREPLKTLERFNILKDPVHIEAAGKAPVMGINLGLKNMGKISVGDEVYISTSQD